MNNNSKYYDVIKGIDLSNEEVIKKALEEAGLYSKLTTFPLASLQFELTSHCNARCRHCYNNSGIMNGVPDKMTPEKWIEFAQYLVKKGGVFECLISGGEPLLLGDDLFRFMDIFHEDGSCFLFQTNGFLLNSEVAKRLKKYRYHWVQISIDGVDADYHDCFRNLKGSWERAVNAALELQKNSIPYKVAFCVTPYNLHTIDDMCDFVYAIGASAITVGEVCLSGRVFENQDLLLSNEQRTILQKKVEENREKFLHKMVVKTSNSVKEGLERQRKKPYISALIRPNGDIRIDGMAPFVIGNVLEDDFAQIWNEKINLCWYNPKVIEFINGFNEDDRNYEIVNFVHKDMNV